MNKKKKRKIIITTFSLVLIFIVACILAAIFSLSAPGSSDDITSFTVSSGESKQEIASNLKDAGIIRSKYALLMYVMLSGKQNIQAGVYELNRGMSAPEILNALVNGEIAGSERETVSITFREGITLKEYMQLLADNTNLEYDTIITEINDPEYLNSLINDYWFLTDDILNDELYYGLEGYLYPETYEFYVDTTFDSAVRKLLDGTDKILGSIREEINDSEYSIHEIITMASIVEKEALNAADRAMVAQVINKRIELNMNLGMDVTSYYGVQKDMKESLTVVDLNDNNPYNTRVATFLGLPVGPICNPSLESIEAVLNPADTDYIYFYADIITGNVYFTDDYNEFLEFERLYG